MKKKATNFKLQAVSHEPRAIGAWKIIQLSAFNSPLLATADIHDIRGPIHIPYAWLWILYVVLGLISIALLFWLYRFWKHRHQALAPLPHQIALEQLQEAIALMQAGRAREFSILVSSVIRSYIEKRFQIYAAHRTTEEFLHDLLADTSSPLVVYFGSLEDFLKHCDLAKFARWSLSASEMQSMYESACKFIEETKPNRETQNTESGRRNISPTKSHEPLKFATSGS